VSTRQWTNLAATAPAVIAGSLRKKGAGNSNSPAPFIDELFFLVNTSKSEVLSFSFDKNLLWAYDSLKVW